VFQARNKATGQDFAIKKVFQDNKHKNRELEIMREIYHDNIVNLKEAYYTKADNKF
jgi:glycogen synthase kinase 3 beta